MAGDDRGELKGCDRSSEVGGCNASVHGRSNRWRFWGPGVALSTVVCSVAALGDSGHGGDMNGGAELSAVKTRC